MNQKLVDAFCSDLAPEIFHPVAHTNDVWRHDPFDVREVHQEAREAFEELVDRSLSPDETSGRILLLKGEAGAGKTHLLRAFRNFVHEFDRSFFAYMQMTTSVMRYDRYVLQKLIDSLDQPYHPPTRRLSSLRTLSNALADLLPKDPVSVLRATPSTEEAGAQVNELADRLVDRLELPELDLHVLRALLYLQNDRPSVKIRVVKYLRMEPFSDYDSEVLGGMPARDVSDDPTTLIRQLAAIMRTVLNRSLVVCIDQLEDMFNLDDTRTRFARAMDAVTQIGEIPGAVVVVACLEAFYEQLRGQLNHGVLARLEQDPRPLTLKAQRTPEEASRIVGRRLGRLFECAGASVSDLRATDPIPPQVFAGFRRGTTRMLLEDCLRYRESAQNLRRMPETWPPKHHEATGTIDLSPGVLELVQAWNDFSSEPQPIPEDDEELLQVLASAITTAGEELGAPNAFQVSPVRGKLWLRVKHGPSVQGAEGDLLVALCERSPNGGGLLHQLEDVRGALEKGTHGVIVRSLPFPSGPNGAAAKSLGKIIAAGGRRAVIEDIEWRHMVALDAFRRSHDGPAFHGFLASELPMSTLTSMREILDLEDLTILRAPPPAAKAPPPGTAKAPGREVSKTQKGVAERVPAPRAASGSLLPNRRAIVLGETLGRKPQPVRVEPEDLKRHMAFMGGTGSGKTTAALHVIESLLAQGVPAILVDRKGDLCGYRRPEVWTASVGDPERDAFRAELRSRVEVAVYTPGNAHGRGLALSLIPKDAREMSEADREHLARISAGALADMMAYGSGQKPSGKRAALQVALQQLAAEEDEVTVAALATYLREKDDALIGELGTLAKFVDDLALDLEILARKNRSLFGEGCEPLDAGALLGRPGNGSGKTRLSIVSTKLLGSAQDELFWVAQLLLELYRWASKHPSDALQAVVLLDEADKYLPAQGQPATKQPVEDLLRRARSMGVGVFLASQNPGDFDYRCRDNIRTWLVGLLTQKRGIEKLEELFGPNGDTSQLASQTTGQFHLLAEGQVSRVQMCRNAVKLPSQVGDGEVLRLAALGPAPAGT